MSVEGPPPACVPLPSPHPNPLPTTFPPVICPPPLPSPPTILISHQVSDCIQIEVHREIVHLKQPGGVMQRHVLGGGMPRHVNSEAMDAKSDPRHAIGRI